MSMKGITPVIAIVLLLMITISMVGFAFIWFQRISNILQNKTETGLEQQLEQITISIDNVDSTGGSVTIRNTGTVTVQTSQIAIYVNGTSLASCSWDATEILPNGHATCSSSSIKNCNTIKATAKGSFDVVSC